MSAFINFEALQNEQFVKVNGKLQSDGTLLAVEVNTTRTAKYEDDQDKMQSVIQHIDQQSHEIKVLNQTIPLSPETVYRTISNKPSTFSDFYEGEQVKIRGYFEPGSGFLPSKITAQETLEFNVDEIEGQISGIDYDSRTFSVNGIRVVLDSHSLLLK